MMTSPKLISLQVALPKNLGTEGAKNPHDRSWSTGFFKEPIAGPAWLGETNLVGDGQADLTVHGGPDKAVLVYSAEHYPLWKKELKVNHFPYGAFGENFTVSNMTEQTVCIGDRYALGDAVVEVSQPRQPCWKLARRWRMRKLPALVAANGRSGWYIRVIQEGYVEMGNEFKLIEQSCPELTISRVNDLMYNPEKNISALHDLIGCKSLAENLRFAFASFLQ